MNNLTNSKGIVRAFVLFGVDIGGEQYIFCHKNDGIELPGVELLDGNDPETFIKKGIHSKYNLELKKIQLYSKPPFSVWDEGVGKSVSYEFYKALEYSGELPKEKEFYAPAGEIHDFINKMSMEFKPQRLKRI
jgi:hypothetical protein